MVKIGGGELPPFEFPVLAWSPQLATNEEGDDGTRFFTSPKRMMETYFPQTDLRLGWTFVDVQGSAWVTTRSIISGRADPWWCRWMPRWMRGRRYRLDSDFEPCPPIDFDSVKQRLVAAREANINVVPRRYSDWTPALLRRAKTLNDFVVTDEDRWKAAYHPPGRLSRWLLMEGRCSRRSFLAVVVGLLAATQVFGVWLNLNFPAAALVLPFGLLVAASAVARRLHDLGRSGWWIALWFACTLGCLQALDDGGPVLGPLGNDGVAVLDARSAGLAAAVAGSEDVQPVWTWALGDRSFPADLGLEAAPRP